MSYRVLRPTRSNVKSCDTIVDGESIEQKVARVQEVGEPIKDGAPEIYTERKEGVVSAYNIRTDRWEIATEAMDSISRGRIARRDNAPDTKVVDLNANKGQEGDVGEAKS